MRLYRLVGLLSLGSFALVLARCGSERAGEERSVGSVRGQLTATFSDVTAASGIGVNTGNGVWPGHGSWAGVWADVDQDGDVDLLTLGHLQPTLCGDNQYWRNNGDGTFSEATLALGIDDRDGIDLEDPDCANASTVEDGSERAIFQQAGTNSCADGWDNGHRIDTHGAVWGDFDRDSDLDLVMVNETISGQPWLYHAFFRNDGSGFAEIADEAGVLGFDHITRGTAAADYDRDGLLDIFMVTWQAQLAGNPHPDFSPDNLLFHNNGDLTFSDVGATAGVAGPSGKPCSNPGQADASCGSGVCALDGTCASKKRTAEWLDYNNDGWPDLFINPPCGLLRNNGDGSFTNVTEAAGIEQTEECQGSAVSDYDNDGDLDIYSTRGFARPAPDVLYRNNGDGTFTDVTRQVGISNTPIARAASWGDFDNDGDEDLYVVNFAKPTIPNRLFQNNGDGTFSDVGTAAGVAAQVQGFGCALDPPDLTQSASYCSTWQPRPGQVTAGGSDGSFVDYDGDGDLDLFVTNGEANCRGPYVLLANNGNGNHWLKLELLGTTSNPDALMSRVTVRTPSAARRYFYSGQHHFMAQNKVPLHVGLGADTQVESVTVSWPNGLVETFEGLEVDRTHRLIEGSGESNGGGGAGGTGGGGGSDGGGSGGIGGSGGSDGGGAGGEGGATAGSGGLGAGGAAGSGGGGAGSGGSAGAGGSSGGSSNGPFMEVAQQVGLVGKNSSWGMAWADWDNDGHLDVLTYSHLPEITCSATQLWHNDGDGTFTDVTLAANLASDDGTDTAPLADPDVCTTPTPNCIPCAALDGKSAELIDAHDQGDTHGAVWLDFNRDGCKDFYIVNGSTKQDPNPTRSVIHFNKLWRNNCDGTFTDIGPSANVLGVAHRGRGAFAFDIDVDGWPDLFSTAFDRQELDFGNLLHRNNRDNTFTDLAPAAGIARDDADNRSAAWVDYDSDGSIDIIVSGSPPGVASSGGPCVLWHNQGDGSFENATVAAGLVEDVQCVGFAFADYDNDGFMDLYLTRGFGPPGGLDILYRNLGNGTFQDVTASAGISNPGLTRGVAAGDYDNDGDVDFYVVNLNHGNAMGVPTNRNRLWSNNGDGTFSEVGVAEGVVGQVFVEGDPPVSKIVRAGMSAAFIDYDRDGFLDISVTNGEGQIDLAPYFLFRNLGRSGHYLEVDLKGTTSDPNGLGAKLVVEGASGTRHRYQGGPQHLLSQSLVPVHFGLGSDSVVKLTVTWPSGTVQVLENVAADQLLTLVEGVNP